MLCTHGLYTRADPHATHGRARLLFFFSLFVLFFFILALAQPFDFATRPRMYAAGTGSCGAALHIGSLLGNDGSASSSMSATRDESQSSRVV